MEFHYTPHGVCSLAIDFTIEDGIITNVSFTGGCDGNTQGLSKLAVGMRAEEVAERLRGIHCGFKETSCPDQLARAVEKALNEVSLKEKTARPEASESEA